MEEIANPINEDLTYDDIIQKLNEAKENNIPLDEGILGAIGGAVLGATSSILYVFKDVEGNVAYGAKSAVLSTVADHVETKVDEGALTLTTKGFKCGNTEIPMNDILDLAMHGQRAIVFSTNEKYYELIPSGEANALKFFLYFEGWKKQLEGKEN